MVIGISIKLKLDSNLYYDGRESGYHCRPLRPRNQRGSHKSPGHDGYPIRFYQHMCDSIDLVIINVVQDLFISKSSLSKINKTFTMYILKKTHLQKMYDFRSISLCNIIYKSLQRLLLINTKRSLEEL